MRRLDDGMVSFFRFKFRVPGFGITLIDSLLSFLRGVEIEALVSRLAWEVGFEHQVIITTVEYTPDIWYDSPLRESPFVKNINHEGVSL